MRSIVSRSLLSRASRPALMSRCLTVPPTVSSTPPILPTPPKPNDEKRDPNAEPLFANMFVMACIGGVAGAFAGFSFWYAKLQEKRAMKAVIAMDNSNERFMNEIERISLKYEEEMKKLEDKHRHPPTLSIVTDGDVSQVVVSNLTLTCQIPSLHVQKMMKEAIAQTEQQTQQPLEGKDALLQQLVDPTVIPSEQQQFPILRPDISMLPDLLSSASSATLSMKTGAITINQKVVAGIQGVDSV